MTFSTMTELGKELFKDDLSFLLHQLLQVFEESNFDNCFENAIEEDLHIREVLQRIKETASDSDISVDEGRKLVQPYLERFRAYFYNKANIRRLTDQALRRACTVPDVQMGMCPLFFGDFSPEDLEICEDSTEIISIQSVLRKYQILQFFFPPVDQLALGLIDRLSMPASGVTEQILMAPALGHPIVGPEICQDFISSSPSDIIAKLQERGLAVEGELGLELSPEGQTIRQVIRFKPREGVLSKILNRFSVNLDFKDLFKH